LQETSSECFETRQLAGNYSTLYDSQKLCIDEEEEEAEEAKEEASHPPKRQRKENTMVGGVRKGKYSKN